MRGNPDFGFNIGRLWRLRWPLLAFLVVLGATLGGHGAAAQGARW